MINLKYSKDVLKDHAQLSDGRKEYIMKRADKKGISVFEYLLENIEERCKAERKAEKREQERHAAELLKQQQQKQAMLAISDLQRVWFQGRL